MGADMAQDVVRRLLPHARQLRQAAIQRGPFQIGYRADLQLLNNRLDGFRPHTGDFQQIQHAGGKRVGETVVSGYAAGGHQFLHFIADGLAHAGDFAEVVPGRGGAGQRIAQLLNGVGRPAVSPDFERRVAADFQQSRHIAEQADDVLVADLRTHTSNLITRRRKGARARLPLFQGTECQKAEMRRILIKDAFPRCAAAARRWLSLIGNQPTQPDALQYAAAASRPVGKTGAGLCCG